jgi:hypothetical protein
MAFPALQPSSRDFEPGDYPVKTFRSQSGVESRILYGSKRSNQALTLTYQNITDSQAEQFITHFDQVRGSFDTFTLPAVVRAGWQAGAATIDAVAGAAWRYDGPPSITSVKPGISTVQLKLAAVL